jgi:hypothetical protein
MWIVLKELKPSHVKSNGDHCSHYCYETREAALESVKLQQQQFDKLPQPCPYKFILIEVPKADFLSDML